MLQYYVGNSRGGIYLNEYLPQAVSEQRRREREIKSIVKSTSGETVEHTKTGLKIGKSLHKKKVTAPSPTDLLDLSPQELDNILGQKINKGPTLRVEDSVFTAYTADVDNHQRIRQLYLKVRLQQARARHVVCAYNIPGSEIIYSQDFEDDGETGAGKTLLQAMLENDIHHKVIFVVRLCGKSKLGDKHLSSYILAANAGFKATPPE